MISILGEPSRLQKEELLEEYFYDDLGVSIHIDDAYVSAIYVNIVTDGSIESTISAYSGTLMLGGKIIDQTTGISDLEEIESITFSCEESIADGKTCDTLLEDSDILTTFEIGLNSKVATFIFYSEL